MQRALSSLVLLAALTVPWECEAQQPTWRLGGRILFVSASATSDFVGDTGLVLATDDGAGLELDATVMFHPRFGAALTIGGSAHDLRAVGDSAGCCGIDGDTAWLVPITATVRYHPPVFGAWDPYLGIGVGWLASFYSVSDEFAALGVDELDLEADAGIAAQVGVNYALGESWYLNLDIRYLSTTLEARIRGSEQDFPAVDLEIDPLLFGFGIGWRF